MADPWPAGCRQPRMAGNAAQHKIVNLLKILLSFLTKFYYLDTYIFYIGNHKLGACSTILKDHRKGCCVIRVFMSGLFRLSGVADIMKIMHRPFSAHQFSLVFVYVMCGPSEFFLQCGPETPKGWTPLGIFSWGILSRRGDKTRI